MKIYIAVIIARLIIGGEISVVGQGLINIAFISRNTIGKFMPIVDLIDFFGIARGDRGKGTSQISPCRFHDRTTVLVGLGTDIDLCLSQMCPLDG